MANAQGITSTKFYAPSANNPETIVADTAKQKKCSSMTASAHSAMNTSDHTPMQFIKNAKTKNPAVAGATDTHFKNLETITNKE